MSEIAARLAKYEAGKRRAVDYILSHANADGSYGPVEGFGWYRLPWTFMLAGETGAASRICHFVRTQMFTPEGDFDRGLRQCVDAYGYRNSAFVIGAQMARQHDMSYGAMRLLLSLQDPISGGFANDMTPDGPSDAMDIPYACGPGFACLMMGQLEPARRVYGFLKAIWERQTDPSRAFYYTWSRAKQNLIREFEPDDALWYVVEPQRVAKQRWTVGGIAAGFLCRLYLAEPLPEYLKLARQYQAFSMSCTEGQFQFAQVCKSSWGSSMLYLITGEKQYRDWTIRMGDWYLANQAADGTWPGQWFVPSGKTADLIHLNAEFAMHLDTIITALSARG